MNKKILMILSSIILIAILFVGCSSNSNNVDASSDRFIVSNSNRVYVSTFVDSKTGVEYAVVMENGHGNMQVIMLQNADGTPKVR